MNYFYQTVIATVLHLKRTCPTCKKEQVTKPSDKDRTVNCKFCGSPIPPKKK